MEPHINADNYFENVKDVHINYGKQQILPNSIPSIKGFVGRDDYLIELRESYQKGSRCFVLHGIGGVGKSALALQFAEEMAGEYAAKIFVDMQGMSETPLSARDAMLVVVREFERDVPVEISDAQLKNLFISKVQTHQPLIVLDNAKNVKAVESLNQSKACLIVTSRESFSLTDGIEKQIAKMLLEDARQLLFKNGDGEERFDGRADELAELSGCLPMALKPLAALLKENKLETAANLITKYQNKKELLKERVPDYNDLTIEASFELSYEILSDEFKERWRRLSVFPTDFDEAAIAAVLEISPAESKETQEQLCRFSLLEVNTETKRFNLHDLIRVFTYTKLSDDECFQAQFRHSSYYSQFPQKGYDIQFSKVKNAFLEAINMLDLELVNIKAGLNWAENFVERNDQAARLFLTYTGTGRDLMKLRLNPHENLKLLKIRLTAAQRLNDRISEGDCLLSLGIASKNFGKYEEAIGYYNQALPIHFEVENWESICLDMANLGIAYFFLSNYSESNKWSQKALAMCQKLGNIINVKHIENNVVNNLSNIEIKLGNSNVVIKELKEKLKNISDSSQTKSNLLGTLGTAHKELGDYSKAARYYKRALRISCKKLKDKKNTGIWLGNLGIIYDNLDNIQKACDLWKEAAEILTANESPEANIFQRLLQEKCEN